MQERRAHASLQVSATRLAPAPLPCKRRSAPAALLRPRLPTPIAIARRAPWTSPTTGLRCSARVHRVPTRCPPLAQLAPRSRCARYLEGMPTASPRRHFALAVLLTAACTGDDTGAADATGDAGGATGADTHATAASQGPDDDGPEPTSAVGTSPNEGPDTGESTTSREDADSDENGDTDTVGDADTDGGSVTGSDVECVEGLHGAQSGCPCESLAGDGFPPHICANELICDTELLCTDSNTCDVVVDDPNGNDTFETATELGMLCHLHPVTGRLEPGDVDWYTWTEFDFQPTCANLWSARTYDGQIDVCLYAGCEGEQGTVTPGNCGPTAVADSLAPDIHGCCGTSGVAAPNNTLDCPQGEQHWARVESTAAVCVGYELELN